VRPARQRGLGHVAGVEAGERDDAAVRRARGDRVDAVQAGHRQVEQHDIRPQGGHGLEAGVPVGRLADDREDRVLLERVAHERAEARGVVAQQHADLPLAHGRSVTRG
jgi:hypothetical protein